MRDTFFLLILRFCLFWHCCFMLPQKHAGRDHFSLMCLPIRPSAIFTVLIKTCLPAWNIYFLEFSCFSVYIKLYLCPSANIWLIGILYSRRQNLQTCRPTMILKYVYIITQRLLFVHFRENATGMQLPIYLKVDVFLQLIKSCSSEFEIWNNNGIKLFNWPLWLIHFHIAMKIKKVK